MKIVTIDLFKLENKLYPPPPPPPPPTKPSTANNPNGYIGNATLTGSLVNISQYNGIVLSNCNATISLPTHPFPYRVHEFLKKIPNILMVSTLDSLMCTNRFLFNSESEELINFLFEYSDCIIRVEDTIKSTVHS